LGGDGTFPATEKQAKRPDVLPALRHATGHPANDTLKSPRL
jgi:hypothetical protein